MHLSPCDWDDVFLDQMAQVRRGERKNGAWHVEIAQAGHVRVHAPPLAGRGGRADRRGARRSIAAADGVLPAGIALPIAKARLKIGNAERASEVAPTDKSIAFTLELSAGPAELQTWFTGADGQDLCGAYFVEVRRK